MFPLVKKTVSALFVSTLLASAPAFADIIISGTRIIYNADKKDVNVRLENKGNRPLLIQNWLIRAMTMPIPARSKCRLPRPHQFHAWSQNAVKP